MRGIGGQIVVNSNSLCSFSLYSREHDKDVELNCIVVPKITRLLPNFFIPKTDIALQDITELTLEDLIFHSPVHFDLLIDSNLIHILLDRVKKQQQHLSCTSNHFRMGNKRSKTNSGGFWKQEENPHKRPVSAENEYCQSLFQKMIAIPMLCKKLPFKTGYPQLIPLGASCTCSLIRMEQYLEKKPELGETYNKVLREYLTLEHMERTTSRETYSN